MSRGLRIALLVTGGLVAAGAGTCTATYLTMKRGVHYATPLVVDGKPDTVQVHYNHWFPRWRRSFDFAMGGHAWFRDAPQFRAPVVVHGSSPSRGVVQRWMMAHALAHRVQELREGSLAYKLGSAWEFLTIWTWADRPRERWANAWQHEIAAGVAPFIQVPRLTAMFPGNLAEPPDTDPPPR